MLVSESTFVVVDTETTGGSPGTDRLIEIGAVKVCAGEVVDRYSTLINPMRAIPSRITRLTGISTAMVFDQPPAEAVLPDFRDFLGDSVFVAHNLGFDWRFIDAELDRAGMQPLRNDGLCTLRLARRVLRGLRSKGLSSLSDHYGIRISRRHRALDDAEATAIILTRLLASIEFEHNVDTLDGVLTFQRQTYGTQLEDAAHVRRIREEILPLLPRTPGVYFMRNRKGKVIYVGKAKSIRSRVRTYFTAIESHASRTRKLVREVRDVTWRETGSELAALLEESRLIKEHQPRHNRALKRYGRRPFIRLDTNSGFPSVSFVHQLVDDGSEYFGPIHGGRNAAFLVDLIDSVFNLRACDDRTLAMGRKCMYADMGRCLAPCEHDDGRYGEEVERVRQFLLGKDGSIPLLLEERMREAAQRLDFEEAREYRDWIAMLERLLAQQREVASPVLDHNAVILQPAVDPNEVQLFFVRFGRYVYNMMLPRQPTHDDFARLCHSVETFFSPNQLRPARYHKREVDEISILLNWMYTNRDTAETIAWDGRQPANDFAAAIVGRVREQSANTVNAMPVLKRA